MDDFTISGTDIGTPDVAVAVVSNSGGTTYDVTASGGDLATADAMVMLGFANGQNIQDEAGNALTDTDPEGDNHNTYVVDNTDPTVEISGLSGTITGAVDDVTFTFSEAVTDFVVGDITVSKGAASNFSEDANNPNTVWSATIMPSTNGTDVTVSVPANVASDAAGNNNEAATAVTVRYTAPWAPRPRSRPLRGMGW